MALDFPASPTTGQTYTPAGANGAVWKWDGAKWVAGGVAAGGGGSVTSVTAGTGITATPNPITVAGTVALAVPVAPANGGTGLATYAQGDIIYASAANTLVTLAKDTGTTRFLGNTGTSNNPAWGQVPLTTGVSGVLPVANGGTGASVASAGPFVQKVGDTMSGNLTIAPASDAFFTLTKAAVSQSAAIYGKNGANTRWHINLANGNAESGSNAGSNFEIARYNDAGAIIDNPLVINRATGETTLERVTITPIPGSNEAIVGVAATGGSANVILTGPGLRDWRVVSQTSGNFGVLDAIAPAWRLEIHPDGSCWNATGTWNSMSDISTKRDVQDYTRGLADLVQLRPVMYKYNGEGGTVDDGQQMYGLVAQEAEEHVPEIVTTREGDLKGVDSGRLIFSVLNALREIEMRLRALEGK